MTTTGLSRRELMKTTLAGVAAGAWGALSGRPAITAAPSSESEIMVAGYDYDRLRAIVDGTLGIPGSQVTFEAQDIYTANRLAFGPERT